MAKFSLALLSGDEMVYSCHDIEATTAGAAVATVLNSLGDPCYWEIIGLMDENGEEVNTYSCCEEYTDDIPF